MASKDNCSLLSLRLHLLLPYYGIEPPAKQKVQRFHCFEQFYDPEQFYRLIACSDCAELLLNDGSNSEQISAFTKDAHDFCSKHEERE